MAMQDFYEKAERFLHTARATLEIGDWDSCVSRCYYAMFFMAEAALLTKGITANSHRGVINLFGKHFVKTGVFPPEFGRALGRAYDERLVGDYGIEGGTTKEDAEMLLETPILSSKRSRTTSRA